MSPLAPALQAYFTDRLIGQRAASPNTIEAYKVTFRLMLAYAAKHTRKAPGTLDIADLDATLVAAFLDHLEHDRHNSAATRNNRLAALHSLFGYLALQHPEHAATVQRVLAIPPKRTERNLVTYLTEPEVDALLDACDQATWTGRRDHAMFALIPTHGCSGSSPTPTSMSTARSGVNRSTASSRTSPISSCRRPTPVLTERTALSRGRGTGFLAGQRHQNRRCRHCRGNSARWSTTPMSRGSVIRRSQRS